MKTYSPSTEVKNISQPCCRSTTRLGYLWRKTKTPVREFLFCGKKGIYAFFFFFAAFFFAMVVEKLVAGNYASTSKHQMSDASVR
jgi:hypothetical protein